MTPPTVEAITARDDDLARRIAKRRPPWMTQCWFNASRAMTTPEAQAAGCVYVEGFVVTDAMQNLILEHGFLMTAAGLVVDTTYLDLERHLDADPDAARFYFPGPRYTLAELQGYLGRSLRSKRDRPLAVYADKDGPRSDAYHAAYKAAVAYVMGPEAAAKLAE